MSKVIGMLIAAIIMLAGITLLSACGDWKLVIGVCWVTIGYSLWVELKNLKVD